MSFRFIRSRVRSRKCYILLLTFLISSLCIYVYKTSGFVTHTRSAAVTNASTRSPFHISKIITVVFRQFEEYENDISASVQALTSSFPKMPILIICDQTPYPPFTFTTTNMSNVQVLSMEWRLNATPKETNPLKYIKTEYVLLVPDGTRVSRKVLLQATKLAMTSSHMVAIGIGSSKLTCQSITWHYVDWTLMYHRAEENCDAVKGEHALLLTKSVLHKLSHPFVLPLPEALYLQTSVRNIVVQIFDGNFSSIGYDIDRGVRWYTSKRVRDNREALYKSFGIKTVIREDRQALWFGCKRDTERCFPPVQGVPSFILAGRNMPPCCRRHLRHTVDHVLQSLMTFGVRCWLETTSLLGAVIRKDILPYMEYAEIGVHASDLHHITWMSRDGVDSKSFIWERATRGKYYRVSYSKKNNIYVLLLPFVERNGTMWPDYWVLAHQKPFPERHLHPLEQIKFVGRLAPTPNDPQAFLNLKLGPYAVKRSIRQGAKLLYP